MVDIDFTRLKDVLRATTLPKLLGTTPYEICLTGPSVDFTKFPTLSADDLHADIPDEVMVEPIPELRDTYFSEVVNAIHVQAALSGFSFARAYLFTVPPVTVTPMRQSMGKTFVVIDLSRHRVSAWLTKSTATFTKAENRLFEITPAGEFVVFNGSLTTRTVMMVFELNEN